jgi:hypothetical protein
MQLGNVNVKKKILLSTIQLIILNFQYYIFYGTYTY